MGVKFVSISFHYNVQFFTRSHVGELFCNSVSGGSDNSCSVNICWGTQPNRERRVSIHDGRV